MKHKPTIVISAINIFEGGALVVLTECLAALEAHFSDDYRIVALVHRSSLFDLKYIELLEFPKSRSSYVLRCYYEYVIFKKLSKQLKANLWFSLHDMTPRVTARIRAVYCHNPSPFYQSRLKDWRLSPTVALFSVFYKYLYRINIQQNNYVVVQQNWLAKAFAHNYNLEDSKLLVAKPLYDMKVSAIEYKTKEENASYSFFYPAYPRVFKNHELICEAVKKLNEAGVNDFEVYLTIDGSEDAYAHMIVKKYDYLSQLKFIGRIDRNEVQRYYEKTDALLFPSKLETWGLPISEFSAYDKPILAADLPYAYETGDKATKIAFFNSEDPFCLVGQMQRLIKGDEAFLSAGQEQKSPYQQSDSWLKLFNILLK